MRGALVTLAAAASGTALATAAGLPAGPLVGAAVASAGAAVWGGGGALPDWARDAAFCAIGVTLGAAVQPGILAELSRWPLSLAMLAAVVVLTMAGAGAMLRRAGLERGTALLAVSPGALSLALALSEDTGRDTRAVAVMQAVRLLLVTVALPPLLLLAGSEVPGPAGLAAPDTGYGAGAVLLLASFALGRLGARLRVPAAFLQTGVLLSGAAHVAGLVEGRLPEAMSFVAFAVAGAVVGARLARLTGAEARGAGLRAAATTAFAAAVAAGGAALVADWLDLPFGQVMIAFAPGGVEAMAGMAVFLGYDPIYVGAHHLARILGLAFALPLLLAWLDRPQGPP